MEGVARLASSNKGTSVVCISNDEQQQSTMNSVLEDYERGDSYAYDNPIPVMETSGQDVLALEMNHQMGYLDTREFGKASQYSSMSSQPFQDDYSEMSDSVYDHMMGGGTSSSYATLDTNQSISSPSTVHQHKDEYTVVEEKGYQMGQPGTTSGGSKFEESKFDCEFESSSQKYANDTSQERYGVQVPQGGQQMSKYETVQQQQRYDSQQQQLPSLPPPRQVPIFPVKTADPSTCSQYAPVRTTQHNGFSYGNRPNQFTSSASSSSRRSASRSTAKKEALDPKGVEEEVARNVSQILSATKQQRAALEANAARSGGIPTTPPRMQYSCPECHKQVSSSRNLQRHRLNCPVLIKKFPTIPSAHQPLATIISQPLPPVGNSNQQHQQQQYQQQQQHHPQQQQTMYIRRTGPISEDHAYAEWSRSSSVSNGSSLPPSRDEQHHSSIPRSSTFSALSNSASASAHPHQVHHSGVGNNNHLVEENHPIQHHQHHGEQPMQEVQQQQQQQCQQGSDLVHLDPNSFSLHSSSHLLDDSKCLHPLSLDLDDSNNGRESGSGSIGSGHSQSQHSSQGGVNPQHLFQCDACKKTVSSFRSLKRHHTTCKLFAQEFPHLLEQERLNSEKRAQSIAANRARRKQSIKMELTENEAEVKGFGHLDDHMDQSILNSTVDQSMLNTTVDHSILNTSVDQSIKETVEQSIMNTVDQSIKDILDQSAPNKVLLVKEETSPEQFPTSSHYSGLTVKELTELPYFDSRTLHDAANLKTTVLQSNFGAFGPSSALSSSLTSLGTSRTMSTSSFSDVKYPITVTYSKPTVSTSTYNSIGAPDSGMDDYRPQIDQSTVPLTVDTVWSPSYCSEQSTTVSTPSTSQKTSPVKPVAKRSRNRSRKKQTEPERPESRNEEDEEQDERQPSPDSSSGGLVNTANTTCEDCHRQLCSASNLKRHRATCKVAIQKLDYSSSSSSVAPISSPGSSPVKTSIQWSSGTTEIETRERQILDRSYAAALAATQAEQRPRGPRIPITPTQTTVSSMVAPESGQGGQPLQSITTTYTLSERDNGNKQQQQWNNGNNSDTITVGEHLRAQHVQQKMFQQQTSRTDSLIQRTLEQMHQSSKASLHPPASTNGLLKSVVKLDGNGMAPEDVAGGRQLEHYVEHRDLDDPPRSAPPTVATSPLPFDGSTTLQRSLSMQQQPGTVVVMQSGQQYQRGGGVMREHGGMREHREGGGGMRDIHVDIEENGGGMLNGGHDGMMMYQTVDDHIGYGYSSTTDVSDLESYSDDEDNMDERVEGREGEKRENNGRQNGIDSSSSSSTHTIHHHHIHTNGALRAALDHDHPVDHGRRITLAPPPSHHPRLARSSRSPRPGRTSSHEITPLASIITTQPLPSDRLNVVYASRNSHDSAQDSHPTSMAEVRYTDGNRQGMGTITAPLIRTTMSNNSSSHQSQQQPSSYVTTQNLVTLHSIDNNLPYASPPHQQQQSINNNNQLMIIGSPQQMTREALAAVPATPGKEVDLRFQCPECLKTYSCRKNVKRHRMAVHKLTPEEIARNPAPGDMLSQQSAGRIGGGVGSELSSPTHIVLHHHQQQAHQVVGQHQPNYVVKSSDQWDGNWTRESVDDEECAETARIAAELKREAEQAGGLETKKAVAELAEADTTFHEEMDEGLHRDERAEDERGNMTMGEDVWRTVPSSASSSVLSSACHTLSPRTTVVPAAAKRIPHVCMDCNRSLSSDYSLKRHRHTCPEAKASEGRMRDGLCDGDSASPATPSDPMFGHATSIAPQPQQTMQSSPHMQAHHSQQMGQQQQTTFGTMPTGVEGQGGGERRDWMERAGGERDTHEDAPDSTTNQSRMESNANSPGMVSSPSESGSQYDGGTSGSQNPRKRCPSKGAVDGEPAGKVAKHLCQACGKYYSSEWNLERHRRESCPHKGKRPQGEQRLSESTGATEDTVIVVGCVKFAVSRQALSRSSTYFSSLFQYQDPSRGDIKVDVDPNDFQMLLDAHNNPASITATNIDSVAMLADQLKFNTVYEHCEQFIANKLPTMSVMHAIRLAEQLKLTTIKQQLFDSISIDVFRSLSADQDYRLMGADLKAELLEKWGTFL